MLQRLSLTLMAGMAAMLMLAVPAMANINQTGYNITPDSSVTPAGEFVLFLDGEWGNDGYDDGHFVGVSFGVFDLLEIGGSYRLTEDDEFRGDPVFNAKAAFNPFKSDAVDEAGEPITNESGIAVGATNINFDDVANGKIRPYACYTHDFDGVKGTAGYRFEEDNGGFFTGWEAETGDARLLWDWAQVNDGNDWDASVGCEFPVQIFFDQDIAVLTYLRFSSDDNASDILGVEVSYAIPIM